MRTIFGYMSPTYSKSEKINVFSLSKPQAMMSFAFSVVSFRKCIKSSPMPGSHEP